MPKLEKICAIFCNDSLDSDIIDYLRQTECVQTTFIRGSCTPTNGEHITAHYVGGACFSFRKKWLKDINRYIIDYLRQTGCVQTTIIRSSCTPTNGEHITAQYMGGACFSFCKTNGRMLYNRHSILFASSMQWSIHVIDIHVCKLIHHNSTKSYCTKKSLILYIIIIIIIYFRSTSVCGID